MTDPSAPTPSVETILHAILPYRFVDHTHADALLAITNTADGEQRVREIYGDSVVVIPYVMPGFDLARVAAERFPAESGPNTVGMVLLKHGFFSFGDTARESYERMIDLVSRAEAYLEAQARLEHLARARSPAAPTTLARADVAALRQRGLRGGRLSSAAELAHRSALAGVRAAARPGDDLAAGTGHARTT